MSRRSAADQQLDDIRKDLLTDIAVKREQIRSAEAELCAMESMLSRLPEPPPARRRRAAPEGGTLV